MCFFRFHLDSIFPLITGQITIFRLNKNSEGNSIE
jgi:hypothetical protein